jgi:hypothetical protein
MRLAKWCGLTLLVLSLFGIGLGLMQYCFAGFPFGGATAVEEGRAGALRTILISAAIFAVGAVLFVLCRQPTSNRERRDLPGE